MPKTGAAHPRLRSLTIALIALLAGVLLLATPPGAASSHETATVTEFTVSPYVLPGSGGILDITIQADTPLEDLRVALSVQQGTTERDQTELLPLVPQHEGTMVLDHDLTVNPRGSTGDWQIEIVEAITFTADSETRVDLDGDTTASFLVNPHAPAAGTPETPWPQTGGDPAHTGRTLAVGPDDVEAHRWSFESEDDQAFHTPTIDQEGTIYAVTWGGTVYALDEDDGAARWGSPVRLPGPVAYPPALVPGGPLIVVDGNDNLIALDADGTQAWRYDAPGEILSAPTIGPDGRIFLMQEPWTLVQIENGQTLHATPLPEPEGGAPQAPTLPEPTAGPRIAVTPDGSALALSGDGLALVLDDGTIDDRGADDPFACECTPRAVSLDQHVPRAVLIGDDTLSVFSVRTGLEIWRLTEQIPLDGDTWHAPTITWDDRIILTTDQGRIISVSLTNPSDVHHVNFRDPVRGQPIVDANENLYFADACDTLRSITTAFEIRWSWQIQPTPCHGLTASPTITPNGNLLWPAPDDTLRLLGDNRAPIPDFDATWTDGAFHLDASNSTDPDRDPLTYAWNIGNHTQLDGRTVQPEIPQPGAYIITLTVSDGITTASTSRDVIVNFPPHPRIADESSGMDIQLNATDTHDEDGDTLHYNWTVNGEPAGTGPVLTINATDPRVYDVQLAVDDGHHTVTEQRNVLAPHEDAWVTERVALYDEDCPASLCATPETLTLTNQTLLRIHVINGADRTLDIESPFPLIPGGIDKTRLSPGESHLLSVRVDDVEANALIVQPAHTPAAPTLVPATVLPAPAGITWSLAQPEDALLEGQPANLDVHLEGDAPPRATTLHVTLATATETLAQTSIDLPANEPVDTDVPLPWTPGRTGTHEATLTVEAQDETAAIPTPAPEQPATLTLAVEDAPWTLQATHFATENVAWIAAAITLLATLTIAGFVLYRRTPEDETTFPPAQTTTPAKTNDDATVASSFMPRKVERFRIEQVLGEGGFGKTYLAHDTVLERDVVLKELEHVGEESRKLLLHEAKTAANLSHPNVVVVHDVIEEQGRLLLVMEYVPGGTLQDHIHGSMPLNEALPLVTDMLEGLEALHQAGIVHRDVKPSNILITPDSIAKITDFGVAATLDGAPPTENGTFVGTPRYMAPEQLAGDTPGPQADVYAAGALLYHIITGRHHLGLKDTTPGPQELLERDPELPLPEAPDELNRILEIALARDEAKRYENAQAFLDALESFQANLPPAPA